MGPLQNKNSSFVDELGKLMRKKRLRPLGLVPFQSVTHLYCNSAVVDSMFHQRYHKCQIDPTSVSILAFLKIIRPNFIFCANTLHKNNKQIHLISGSQGVQ